MVLSKRLTAVTDLLPSGNTVADIGCDHGYISITLVQSGKYKRALAMDVRKGPLSIAEDNIASAGLKDQIVTRLSDGLEKLDVGEADSVVIAGMGGILLKNILDRSIDKVKAMNYLVLQPQSDISLVRKYIRDNGLSIIKENMIYEDGKYYPMFLVSYKAASANIVDDELVQEIYDCYGRYLIEDKNETLKEFLNHEYSVYENVLGKLPEENVARKNEIEHAMLLNRTCIAMM